MQETFRILAINPKASFTKIGLYENERCILLRKVEHEKRNKDIPLLEEMNLRRSEILLQLQLEGINVSKLSAVVARGGLLRPIEGGTYKVNEQMLIDLEAGYNGKHPSNFGGLIAHEIAKPLHIESFIVDPVVVDELQPIARITGMPDIQRKSIFHALSQKAAARKAAKAKNITYEAGRFIVVHFGGGITVGAHERGKVIDVNNGLNGEGPVSPERAGTVPAGDLIALCYSGVYTEVEMLKKVTGDAGMKAYLDTADLSEVERMIQEDHKEAAFIYEVMAYQIAKEIGSMSAVLNGQVDAIVLTGRIGSNMRMLKLIMNRVKWIADVLIYPGESDLESLMDGALRVLRDKECAKVYKKDDTEE